MKRFRSFVILASLVLALFQSVQAQSNTPLVLVLKADGVVAPAMQEYIKRGIETAQQRNAELLVIELNTPGGAVSNMLEIIQSIRTSQVPVVVYVTPPGGGAGSAGTLITLAAHASGMAPETTIGAASLVDSQGGDIDSTLKLKLTNDMKALVRSIAWQRSPEAIALAESTIDTAAAFSANEAENAGLVDFIALNLNGLLRQLDGYTVQIMDMARTVNPDDPVYTPRTLHTTDATTEDLPMSLIEELLDILVNPNIVFLLVAIGIQAILIELSSPGGWIAGFIGVVMLALAAYGMGVLSVNWFGAIFLVVAFVLFFLDTQAPTHGALTAAGVGSFIVGALVLFNSPGTPQFQQVSLPLVIITAILIGASFAVILLFALRAQKAPLGMGVETLVGRLGTAKGKIDPQGQVQVQSELWSAELAEGAESIRSGEKVEVVKVEGLRLKVRKPKG